MLYSESLSLWFRSVPSTGLLLLVVSCSSGPSNSSTDAPNGASSRLEVGVESVFREVGVETGLDFQHFNGASGRYYLPEIMGSGAALICLLYTSDAADE